MTELKQIADTALIDTLSPALKAAIDRLHGRKLPRRAIEEFVSAAAKRAGGSDLSLVVLAVQAYLDAKGGA